MRTRKSWREKLETNQQPKVIQLSPEQAGRLGSENMLVSCPQEVDRLIREIPTGELATITELRGALARRHNADLTCPISTGIFVRIAAEAAEEDRTGGLAQITPYWRVLTRDGRLNEKFPGGTEAQTRRLQQEGHSIEPGAGKKAPRVVDFESHLARLS